MVRLRLSWPFINCINGVDMVNIFEVFLPQLLHYPNPTDPLNGEAAALLMRDPTAYELKVKEYLKKYATQEQADASLENDSNDEETENSDDEHVNNSDALLLEDDEFEA